MPTKIAKFAEPELLSSSAVRQLCGGRSAAWLTRMRRNAEAAFPVPVQLGGEFSLAWKRSEVFAWIDSRPRQKPDDRSLIERRQAAKAQRLAMR
jgi:predicted DNA-binding transcriptional regulator AlpA